MAPRLLAGAAAALLLCVGSVEALYGAKDAVVLVTEKDYAEVVTGSDEPMMVEYFAPWCGHCKQLAPEYKKAAKQLEGVAKLVAIDCDEQKTLCGEAGIKGFPTLKWFGADKKSPKDYTGGRDAASIVTFVQQEAGAAGGGGRSVRPLTYLDTYSFLHADRGVPAVILLGEAGAKAPAWLSSLAIKYKDGKKRTASFAFAAADAEPGIARNFGVTPPALLAAVAEEDGGGWFAAWGGALDGKASEVLKGAKAFVDAAVAGDTPDAQRRALPAFPPPDVPRKQADVAYAALTEDNADPACLASSKKSVCVIAFVRAAGDEFPEAAALQDAAKRFRNDPVAFVWLDPVAAKQAAFAEAFGVAAAELPRVVVVKPGKRPRYLLHEGPLTAAALGGLVDRVLGGDAIFKPLPALPALEPAYLADL